MSIRIVGGKIMYYCKQHINRSYTPREYEDIEPCEHSGSYLATSDGKIRIYCFVKVDHATCPLEEKE